MARYLKTLKKEDKSAFDDAYILQTGKCRRCGKIMQKKTASHCICDECSKKIL